MNSGYRASWIGFLCLATGALSLSASVNAQVYPSGVVRIIIPSAAGTPPDTVSRIIAAELGASENWRVIVENRPGAMQTLAASEVLKQHPDGHTLLSTSLPGMSAPALLRNVNFRLDADFDPIIKISTSYNVLVVHPSVAAKSLVELVALIKSQPGRFTFSSGGFGTPAHLIGEMFKVQTGIQTTHVPYQSLPRAIADLINGTNHYQFVTTLPVLDLIATGKLRALAVTSLHRLDSLKNVPTVVEEGFPDLVVQDWFGYLVKSGTPGDIRNRLNTAINKALVKPAVQQAIRKLSAEPAGGSAAEFGVFVGTQLRHWEKIVRAAGMKMHE